MRTIQLSLFHRDNLQSLLNHAFNVAERERKDREGILKIKKFSQKENKFFKMQFNIVIYVFKLWNFDK